LVKLLHKNLLGDYIVKEGVALGEDVVGQLLDLRVVNFIQREV
jgi:hypothetical protein